MQNVKSAIRSTHDRAASDRDVTKTTDDGRRLPAGLRPINSVRAFLRGWEGHREGLALPAKTIQLVRVARTEYYGPPMAPGGKLKTAAPLWIAMVKSWLRVPVRSPVRMVVPAVPVTAIIVVTAGEL